ncbi:hypothetical protein C8J57DRAFT_1590778 [Mycena rebaudengoi]|nr:hypothetical protein C8J57DRAFT_1590778 [Mycena rebaudengoi]
MSSIAYMHSAADQDYIDSLSTRVVMDFRSSLTSPQMLDSEVWVKFDEGMPPIRCRRSRLSCKGSYACERVDPKLINVVRWDLDLASRDAVFAAQRQTRREEGTTAERRVTEIIKVMRDQKCSATDKNGAMCLGVPILKTKNESSRGHDFWVACSGWRKDFKDKHRTWSIPDDIEEKLFIKVFSGQRLSTDNSKDTPLCSAIKHPNSGLKNKNCPHIHIKDGQPQSSFIINRPCHATRTIYVPLDPSIRKALVVHPRNTAHNHPLPPLTKVSYELKKSYVECIKAVGLVGATVAKVDSAPSTQLLLDGERKLLRDEKLKTYPAGLDVPGAFHLFFEDLMKPIDERYIQRVTATPDGGTMILACLAALMRLLDDTGVTSFEADTTFARVAGNMNEWEVVIFLKSLERAVTIARAYVNGASTDFYERLYDEFRAVKMELTGTPVAFKRFVPGGNLLAMNSDMEGAQVLGAARSFLKSNDADYSKISDDTPAEDVAPEFIKLCTTHAKRAVLDFKSLVPEDDYNRLMDFTYIDSEEKLADFSDFVRGLGVKKIQDWWNHKAMSSWILPCLIKSQSPMSAEDWDNTPSMTNTGEAQHHWTKSRTGGKLSLVEAIQSGRKLDESVAREIEISIKSGVLVNSHNESSQRRTRNLTRQSTTIRKSRDSHALTDERARIQLEIDIGKEEKKKLDARLKELQVQRSATGKPSKSSSKSAASRSARTVVVSSSSSGRVTTRTIGIILVLFLQVIDSRLLSGSAAVEPSSIAVASNSTAVPVEVDAHVPHGGGNTNAEPTLQPVALTPTAISSAVYSSIPPQFGTDGPAIFPVANSDVPPPSNEYTQGPNYSDPGLFGLAAYAGMNFGNFELQDYSWLDQFSPLPSGAPLPAVPPMPQLPLMPLVSPPPQAILTPTNIDSGDASTTSKKRKTQEEVDPANVINAKRARKAPRRPDLTPPKRWSEHLPYSNDMAFSPRKCCRQFPSGIISVNDATEIHSLIIQSWYRDPQIRSIAPP